jgi:predicted dehydrogenase
MDENRSGGCLLDQHIHDVDMVNYLFGLPLAVSSLGRNVHPGAGFDAVSTHYRFEGDFIVNAQDDWSMAEVPFNMSFRVNLERGALVFENNALTAYPAGKEAISFQGGEMGYYNELKYFIRAIESGTPIEICKPESARDTIRIACAERESANQRGEWVIV